jgi:hypothetical protein
MKGFGGNKFLGLAVGERGVTACELWRAGGAVSANCAEFVYPGGVPADDPAALGGALRDFLREHRLGARRAVVGLPLKWAVVKPKEIPPSSPAALADMLRLQAERDFAMEPQDLVLEYAGEASATAAGTVLLVAVPRKRLDFVTKMAEAAGLAVEAVTLSSIALAEATGRLSNGEGAILHVASGTAELAVQHRGHPRVLRHLRAPVGASAAGTAEAPAGIEAPDARAGAGATPPAPPLTSPSPGAPRDPAAALTLELRQVLSLMPQNGTIGSGELVLWDGVGLGDAPRVWSDAIGLPVRERSLDSLGVTLANNGTHAGAAFAPPGAGRFAPAAALGLLALGRGRIRPDLLNSRLVEKKKSRAAKPLVWAVVVGSVALFAVAYAAYDLTAQRREVESLKGQLVELQPRLKTGEATIARVTFAQRWQEQDPKFLACLRNLTNVFPDEGQVWANRLTLGDDGRGTMEVQATDYDLADASLQRLQKDGHFKEVKVVTIGATGRNSRDVSFSVAFRFTNPPPPAPPANGGVVNTAATPALDNPGGRAGAATAPATGPSTSPSTAPPRGDAAGESRGGRRNRRRGN